MTIIVPLIVVSLLAPESAYAYFDPGTGSIIIQAAIAGLAAVAVTWGNAKTYVRSLFKRSKESTPGDHPDLDGRGPEADTDRQHDERS